MTNQQPSTSTSRTCSVEEEMSDKEKNYSRSGDSKNGVDCMQEEIQQLHSKRTIVDESGSSPDEKNSNERCQQKKKRKKCAIS